MGMDIGRRLSENFYIYALMDPLRERALKNMDESWTMLNDAAYASPGQGEEEQDLASLLEACESVRAGRPGPTLRWALCPPQYV